MRYLALCLIAVVLVAALGQPAAQAGTAKGTFYTICEGDTLYDISIRYNTTVALLQVVNGIEGDLIFPGQVLRVPVNGGVNIELSPEELMLLARAIHAEARGESFYGKVAVGAVILNRLHSPHFPKDLEGVIYQKTRDVYQFSPVADGSINLTPDDESMRAALSALQGQDPTDGALFFYNPETAQDGWIKTLPVLKRIGNHVFANKV